MRMVHHLTLLGSALLASFSLAWAQNETESAPMTEDVYLKDVPVVLTATRLSQPVADVPMATTVIDRQMIEASGARDIPELFRMVPGFLVGYQNGYTAAVSYHMLSDVYARRMQVLVDGRTVYQPVLGDVPWSALPLVMDDIERIEVIRGPNAASYGANAFLGVVNIITRHAMLDKGTHIRLNVGDNSVRDGVLRYGGAGGSVDYRVTVAYSADDGFEDRYDDKRVRQLTGRMDFAPTAMDTLSLQAGINHGTRGMDDPFTIDSMPPHDKTMEGDFAQINWEHSLGLGEAVSVQLSYSRQVNDDRYLTYPLPAPYTNFFNPSRINVDWRTDGSRYDLELQYIWRVGERIRGVGGGSLREDRVDAPQILGQYNPVNNQMRRLFGTLEWTPDEVWLVHAGAMLEHNDGMGTEFSPRLGVNYHLAPNHTLRLVGSRANRTPSLIEAQADWWTQAGFDASVAALVAAWVADPANAPSAVKDFCPTIEDNTCKDLQYVGNPDLRPEYIRSWEAGYRGQLADTRLVLDAKLYYDEIEDLITLTNTYPMGNMGKDKARIFRNLDQARIAGAELALSYRAVAGHRFEVAYAYTDISATNNSLQLRYAHSAPYNSLNVLSIFDLGWGYNASLGYLYMTRIQGWDSQEYRDEMHRVDARLARRMRWRRMNTEVALALRNFVGDYEEMQLLRKSWIPYRNIVSDSYYLSVKFDLP